MSGEQNHYEQVGNPFQTGAEYYDLEETQGSVLNLEEARAEWGEERCALPADAAALAEAYGIYLDTLLDELDRRVEAGESTTHGALLAWIAEHW